MDDLKADLADLGTVESRALQYRARRLVDRLALALQGALLARSGNAEVADAFCASRLDRDDTQNYGCMPDGIDAESIIDRATPRLSSS